MWCFPERRDLAEELQSRCEHAKVIFMSGYTNNHVLRHGILEEGVHFLRKPFTPVELVRKVRGVLDESGQPS